MTRVRRPSPAEDGGEGDTLASETVVLNRPIAKSMSTELAQLVLNGVDKGELMCTERSLLL